MRLPGQVPLGHEPSCFKCSIHCYSRDMRERIKHVMRYSGPKMLYHRPFQFVLHWLRELLVKSPVRKIRG